MNTKIEHFESFLVILKANTSRIANTFIPRVDQSCLFKADKYGVVRKTDSKKHMLAHDRDI